MCIFELNTSLHFLMLSHNNIYVINILLMKYPSIHIFYARMKTFNMNFCSHLPMDDHDDDDDDERIY